MINFIYKKPHIYEGLPYKVILYQSSQHYDMKFIFKTYVLVKFVGN